MEQVKTEPTDDLYGRDGWQISSHSSVSVPPPFFTVKTEELAREPEVKPHWVTESTKRHGNDAGTSNSQPGERNDTESSAQDSEKRSKSLSTSTEASPCVPTMNLADSAPLSLTGHQSKRHKSIEKAISEENCSGEHAEEETDSSVHDGEDPPTFTCNVCGFRFDTKAKRDKHKIRHTLARPFSCEECDSKFTTKDGLTKHTRRHTGERPYACQFCDARFTQASGLKIHERVHTGERPFVCGECKSGFSTQSQLIGHQRSHTGYKPYACPECPKKFSCSSHVKQHMVKHTGEQKFRCTLCDVGFTQAQSLRAHQRGAHTGEKPYSCTFCSATFARASSRNSHMRKHKDGRPYACDKCSAAFPFQRDLKEHMKTHVCLRELLASR